MGPRTFRPKEIDALFASRYKSYTLTTDHLIYLSYLYTLFKEGETHLTI